MKSIKNIFGLLLLMTQAAFSNPTNVRHSEMGVAASQDLKGSIQVCFYQLPNTGSAARLLPLLYSVQVKQPNMMVWPRQDEDWGSISIFGFFPPASPHCLPPQQFQANCTNDCEVDNKSFELNVKGLGRENHYQIRMRCLTSTCGISGNIRSMIRRIWLPRIGNPPFANNQVALCNYLSATLSHSPFNPQGDPGCAMLDSEYSEVPFPGNGPRRPLIMNNTVGVEEAKLYLMIPYY